MLTSSKKMFTQTCDNQKYFNNNANPSIYEQNIPEDYYLVNNNMYDLKCTEIEHFTEENKTTQIHSDKPHKELNQYSNIEINRNNDDDNNSIRNVVNIDRFIEYFDESLYFFYYHYFTSSLMAVSTFLFLVWEGVIQEISGY